MKLTVLVDNNTYIDRYFLSEPAVSFLIQDNDLKILFDAGYSDIFIRNAYKMDLSLKDLDHVVISHGHSDHTGGLYHLANLYLEAAYENTPCKQPTLVAHPRAFFTKRSTRVPDTGSLIPVMKLSGIFNLNLSKKPLWLTPHFVFLGEIPRNNPFEALKPKGKIIIDNTEEDDYLLDDSALVYKTEEGLVVITGCSHSGICNIIDYARSVCGDDRIRDVIGGFHLQKADDTIIQKTVEYFDQLKPQIIHACHCTDLKAKIALSGVTDLRETGVGLQLEY